VILFGGKKLLLGDNFMGITVGSRSMVSKIVYSGKF
jgi:hypothetical protein